MTFSEVIDNAMNGKNTDEKINYLKILIVEFTKLLEIIIDNLPDDIAEKIIDDTGLLKTRN